jgi:hypothetical protein
VSSSSIEEAAAIELGSHLKATPEIFEFKDKVASLPSSLVEANFPAL